MSPANRIRLGALLGALCLAVSAARAAQTCPAGYPLTTPDGDFADAGNGMVRHIPTGLIWKRCAEGQTWNGGTCAGTAATYTWSQAFDRVEAVDAGAAGTWNAGQTDWRLPNPNELKSLVEQGCYGPSINLTQFPGTDPSHFWSGSPGAGNSGYAWIVNFDDGSDLWGNRFSALQVRLVRAGQYFYNFDAATAQEPAAPTPVPTLSEWGRLLLSGLLGAMAWFGARRRG